MDANRESLLKEIMAIDFTIVDLHLYLNTHPYDQRAIMIRNNCIRKSMMLRNEYESMYGPLNSQLSTSKCPWQWIESPWPWE